VRTTGPAFAGPVVLAWARLLSLALGMHLKNSVRRAIALAGLVTLTGCYTQRPLAAPVPVPTTRIIAELTDSGTVALSDAIGPGALEVEGVVATADADVWKMHLLRVDHRDGRSIPWNRELVSFPRYALTKTSEKRLDRTKSWIAAGAITVAAVLAARAFNLIGSDTGGNGTPIPQESVIPAGGRRE